MPNSSFEFAGHRFTVREAVGADVLHGNLFFANLVDSIASDMGTTTDDLHIAYILGAEWFSGMLFRTTIEKIDESDDIELPFIWISPHSSTVEQVYESYQSVVSGSPVLMRLWRSASRDANLEIPDPEE